VLEVTLVPNRKAVLVAVDGDSRAPVPRYRYRLLRETYRGWNPDQLQPRGKEVNHPLGEEPLKGFEGRDIIAQVIELDGAGTPTGRRGATQFHLDQSTQALRVEIPVRPPQMQTGIVLAGETRLRNPNALRRKGMRACQAFHYPQKMGFLPYARTIFEAQAAFLPHATNI